MAVVSTWHPGKWKAGDLVRWRGIQLVCCTAHKTPREAPHPWGVDPTETQRPSEAALLWTPDGEVQVAKLRALLVDERQSWSDWLRATVNFAAGHVPKAA